MAEVGNVLIYTKAQHLKRQGAALTFTATSTDTQPLLAHSATGAPCCYGLPPVVWPSFCLNVGGKG